MGAEKEDRGEVVDPYEEIEAGLAEIEGMQAEVGEGLARARRITDEASDCMVHHRDYFGGGVGG